MAGQQLALQVLLSAVDRVTKPFKNIDAQNRKLLQGIKDTRAQLKQLETTQKQAGQFKELSRGLQDTRQRMGQAQQRAKELAQQIAAAEKPTRALTREFNAAVREAGKLKDKHQAQTQQLQQLRGKLNEAGISTRQLGAGERDLRAQVARTTQELKRQEAGLATLRDKEKQLYDARRRMQATHNAGMKIAGHGGVAMYAGQRALRGMGGLLGPGVEFDATMSRVQALARLNKDSPDLQALRDQARDLGAKTMFSAVDAAQGQAFLAMAGFSPQNIMAAMPGLLDVAKAGGTDLGVTADIASNILGGFGIDASKMGYVGDVLTKAFTTSNTSLEMLGDTMKYVGPVAKAAGMGLEDAAAMAGLLGNVGIQSSQAGTTLRSMLLRLGGPPKAAAKALARLKVETKDSAGNLRNITEIIGDVAKATEKMGTGERLEAFKHIFGEDPAAGMTELIEKSGTGELLKYINIIKDHQGEAAKAAKVMGDNTTGSLDELSSAWDDVRITLNDSVTPTIRELLLQVTNMVGGLGEWMKANPRLTKGIALSLAALAAVVTVLGAITLAVGTLLMPFAMLRFATVMLGLKGFSALALLRGAIIGVASAIARLATFMLANPLILAITLLALAAFLIYRNWGPIKDFFIGLWDGITVRTAAFWQWLKDSFINAGLAIFALKDRFLAIGAQIMDGLWTGLTSRFTAIRDWIVGLGDQIPQWLREKLGIKSPSRVFAELGKFTMLGLTSGLEGEQESPLASLRGMAERMTAAGAGLMLGLSSGAATAGTGPATPAGAAAGNTYHYEIHVHAAPGMDAQALAQEVRRQLDERDRQQAARKRSALYDAE